MSLIDTITRTMLVKPHPAGYPFIGGALALTIVFLLIWKPLGFFALIITLFIAYFFRDPVRSVPQKESLVLSPADGRIISITPNHALPDELDDELDLGPQVCVGQRTLGGETILADLSSKQKQMSAKDI